jgi:hypothetical protein
MTSVFAMMRDTDDDILPFLTISAATRNVIEFLTDLKNQQSYYRECPEHSDHKRNPEKTADYRCEDVEHHRQRALAKWRGK